MKIKVRMSSGVAYKVFIDKSTIEEAADYLTSVKWIKTDDGSIIFTSNITMITKE